MSKRPAVLAPVAACSLVLLAGTWSSPDSLSSPPPQESFVAQAVQLPPTLDGLSADQVMLQATAAFGSDRVQWLHARLWQEFRDEHIAFIAEGRLLLGPKHCARLEMTLRTGAAQSEILVVSDGYALARALEGQVESQSLTGLEEQEIAAILCEKGCGGPPGLLADLKARMIDVQMDTGQWKGQDVIRLQGNLNEPVGQGAGAAELPAADRKRVPRRVCLFLDAQTLWPIRVEQWISRAEVPSLSEPRPLGSGTLVWQIEFREPRLNSALSDTECIREFTFPE
ncbi:MAG: hypothetical protein L0215_12575 [Gemmataceae bacterium]|nr:hypothetical protein [Gemmataceae bacterium]